MPDQTTTTTDAATLQAELAPGDNAPSHPGAGLEPADLLAERDRLRARVIECFLCHAPVPIGEHVILVDRDWEAPAHPACTRATAAQLAEIQAQACRQGHHLYPGRWMTDPEDPFGDAGLWECARGCGYVRRHPGYGIERAIAAAEGALLPGLPAEPTLPLEVATAAPSQPTRPPSRTAAWLETTTTTREETDHA